MLPRFVMCVVLAASAGCVMDWDRLERAAQSRGNDAGADAMDAMDAMGTEDIAPDGPRCTPAADSCPQGQYCSPTANDCVPGCRNDNDCVGVPNEPDAGADGGTSAPLRCNVSTHTCVPCTADMHCPLGQLCMGNTCVPGCNAGHVCPSGLSCCNGGCVDTSTNVGHCGTCGSVCTVSNATPACVGGACVVGMCMPGRGNCDTSAANGCETDTTTDRANCGACRMACPSYPHAASVCSSGVCSMGTCETGFEDCDRNSMNGCEVNTRVDVMNCGGCGTVCRFEGAAAACMSGICVRSLCATGRGDCDGDSMNGCEVTFATDVMNCGRCGNACTFPNATPTCAAGVCGVLRCNTGFADCDGNLMNGCETNTTTSASHCGTCGNACTFAGGTGECRSSVCVLTGCMAGRDNCDANDANGCETDIRSNLMHCGRCGNVCPTRANATSFCTGAVCGITCTSGFENCDRVDSNGCEVDTRTNLSACGGCGLLCSPPGGTGQCASGVCSVRACNAGLGDCDGSVVNGCETSLLSDLSNCGACGRTCTLANANSTCTTGSCRVTTCTGAFGNCDGLDSTGCETNLVSSSANCGACGNVCPTGTTCVVGRCTEATFGGYTVTTPPTGVVWVDACAAPGRDVVLANADDELYDGTLPFPVWFWGGRNNDFLLSANGVVGFGTLYYNIDAIPGTGPARGWGAPTTRLAPAAYPFGIDLLLGPTGVCVATVGTTPNRTWVAEYVSAQLYVARGLPGSSAFTFEVLAYESNRNIDFLYNTPFTTPAGLTATAPDPITVAVQDYRSITSPRVASYSGTISPMTRVRFQPM